LKKHVNLDNCNILFYFEKINNPLWEDEKQPFKRCQIYFLIPYPICFLQKTFFLKMIYIENNLWKTCVTTPLWDKCEDETHTPKSGGKLESFGTPENSELDCRGQNTSHWGFLYINGKVLKCRCPKWPRMNHLDIPSPSYGQKKGWESN
jgi:hypothetical protein